VKPTLDTMDSPSAAFTASEALFATS